jgi:hypothetical protein
LIAASVPDGTDHKTACLFCAPLIDDRIEPTFRRWKAPMKLFVCDHCGNTVYFENDSCERCGRRLGYWPDQNKMVSVVEDGFHSVSARNNQSFVFCDNARFGACNWLIPADPTGPVFCVACQHNDTIPTIVDPTNLLYWQVMERAKKRLFYSLLQLNLPLRNRRDDPYQGLSFRFLGGSAPDGPPVLTGHQSGVITIALVEADDAEREARRARMGEPYRTLLGHFRHEVGHHYWQQLVANGGQLDGFRAVFGDERKNYGEALSVYYQAGPPTGWAQFFISAYATAHPWEDFAETFAHYLHIVDSIEMAGAFGTQTRPLTNDATLTIVGNYNPYGAKSARELVGHWVPLAALLNNLNRTMGQMDAYPFVLNPPVIHKLDFVHRLIHANAGLPR